VRLLHLSVISALLATVLLAACGERSGPATPARPEDARAMDRLGRLMRVELASDDPAPIERQIRCESARIRRTLGPAFDPQLARLQEQLRQEFAARDFDRLGQRLAHAPTPDGYDPLCRALDAAAAREDSVAARLSPDSVAPGAASP
jgi:hypothetical protein